MYEESIRVPLVVFDPRLGRSERGRTVESLTLNLDFAPTTLEMAGVSVPIGMQGRSLVPLLHGSRPGDWRKDFFYEHHYGPNILPPSEGIRTERWAYFRWLAPNLESEELYDIQSDPLEQHNLATDPARATRLKHFESLLNAARKRFSAPVDLDQGGSRTSTSAPGEQRKK
jgi:arylsulfatase A-like enzyme